MTKPNDLKPQASQEQQGAMNVAPPEESQIFLSTKDYQEYLMDRVSQKLFIKLLAIASIATSLVAALLIWIMNTQLNSSVKSTVIDESKIIQDRLEDRIQSGIANTLVNSGEFRRLLVDKAKEAVGEIGGDIKKIVGDELERGIANINMFGIVSDVIVRSDVIRKNTINSRILRIENYQDLDTRQRYLALNDLSLFLQPLDTKEVQEKILRIIEKDPNLTSDSELRDAYAHCLAQFKVDGIAPLSAWLESPKRTKEQRAVVATALAWIGGDQVVEPLIRLIEQPDDGKPPSALEAITKLKAATLEPSDRRKMAISVVKKQLPIGSSPDRSRAMGVGQVVGRLENDQYVVRDPRGRLSSFTSASSLRVGDTVPWRNPSILGSLLFREDLQAVLNEVWPKDFSDPQHVESAAFLLGMANDVLIRSKKLTETDTGLASDSSSVKVTL
jgi:hypothetical protein